MSRTTPPGYPAAYELSIRLVDGRQVELAPIVPADAAELAAAIRSADTETLHARFLGSPPPLTPAVLDGLTRLDYVHRFAIVARSGGHGVAIARYAALPPSQDGTVAAEIAVAVAIGWRRAGLATALVEVLARRARECGISHFTALFLASNRPVTELARVGRASVVITNGAAELFAALLARDDD